MTRQPVVDLRPYFFTPADVSGRIDWSLLFGNDHPVELDVGCGRGLFLVNAATADPDTNYLGIELDYKEGRRGARRLLKRALPNARVLGGDARAILAERIPPHSISGVHVYFPDPWWKRRHKRRRLVSDEFVNLVAGCLKSGGLLHVWTDVEEYFIVMRALVDHHAAFEPRPTPAERPAAHDLDYQTSFERKKRKLGAAIYRGLWRRG